MDILCLLFYFQFILVLETTHVADHHLVARLEAAYHFYILEVRVAQLHLALYDFVFTVEDKEFVIATTYIVRSIRDAHYVFLYGIHHIDIGLQTRTKTFVAIVG